MHVSIKILAELFKKLFSDIITFHVEEHLNNLGVQCWIDVISTSISSVISALRSVGAISPMLKSLAPKILEDLGQFLSNIIVLFRKKTPKFPETAALQISCQQLRGEHSEQVSGVETENFEHKMGPTNSKIQTRSTRRKMN